MKATVIGAGLAGCEAAWALAQHDIDVDLVEMKPESFSPAHHYEGFAELVCSNSFKADRLSSAGGLLKAEMRELGSVILPAARETRVAAGGSLAVDRKAFSDAVTRRIESHPNIHIRRERMDDIPGGPVIIATGPLTEDRLADRIQAMCGYGYLSFYDAAAPIVSLDSVDMDRVFWASRYGRGEADYLNCPMNRAEYELFYEVLIQGKTVPLRSFEKEGQKVYEGCMPVEVMAKRGPDTLRFGPMKPVGLSDPRTGQRPWAVVQLRKENNEGSLLNLVGFQTNLTFPEQGRIFSLIPGLMSAEFVRYGVMHRNTFLDSPRLLGPDMSLRLEDRIHFAGQITGVEGYMESAASGLYVGLMLARKLHGKEIVSLPRETMMGALFAYVTDESVVDFQPMGANMGLLPPYLERIKGKEQRYMALSKRSLAVLGRLKEKEKLT